MKFAFASFLSLTAATLTAQQTTLRGTDVRRAIEPVSRAYAKVLREKAI